MPTPYDIQLAQRQKEACELLATLPQASEMKWLPAAASLPEHYRSKAKFAVGGSTDHPTLGITGSAPNYAGVDLPHCIAHTEVIASTIEPLKAFIRELHLEPYDIARRRGELKHILVTQGTDDALMIRFVTRSKRDLALLRSKLSLLYSLIPAAQVVTVNILPAHAALVEGDEEIVISEQQTLPMLVGDVELHLGPRSFSQTNTDVASQLYRQVASWAQQSGARACHIAGFIERLPDGYDTVIAENGEGFSQGQKQLLCIARVMMSNPSMLILDEATSSIDTRTELKIQEAFNRLMEGRTSFIVAHRLSTIRNADVILVMKAGHIIEQGNHEELMKKQGFYYTLYESQFLGKAI